MIDINICESSDQKRLGHYLFHSNSITFGCGQYDDLLSLDQDIKANHLTLEIQEFKLYLKLNGSVDFILVNGKRTTARKVLKAKDKLTIGKTQIIINNFLIEKRNERKTFLNKKVDELKESESKLIPILQELNEM